MKYAGLNQIKIEKKFFIKKLPYMFLCERGWNSKHWFMNRKRNISLLYFPHKIKNVRFAQVPTKKTKNLFLHMWAFLLLLSCIPKARSIKGDEGVTSKLEKSKFVRRITFLGFGKCNVQAFHCIHLRFLCGRKMEPHA